MTKLYLTYSEHKTGGEPESDDEWCSYSPTEIDWRLLKCYLEDGPKVGWQREVVEVPFSVKPGQPIFVVYVRYTTGCTFGQVHGVWTIQGVYDNIEDAMRKQDEINLDSKVPWDYDKPETHKPWKGYFDYFEYCDIEIMRAQ